MKFVAFPIGLIAMGTASTLIVDAVAGERERHTLETLLASPASDTGIIVGKMAAALPGKPARKRRGRKPRTK